MEGANLEVSTIYEDSDSSVTLEKMSSVGSYADFSSWDKFLHSCYSLCSLVRIIEYKRVVSHYIRCI